MRRSEAFFFSLALGLIFALAPALAESDVQAPGLEVTITGATLDPDGRNLVIDATLRNASASDQVVLVTEGLVFAPGTAESACHGQSVALQAPPAIQIASDDADPGTHCEGTGYSAGPLWRRSLLLLRAGEEAPVLVAAPLAAASSAPLEARLSFAWEATDSLPAGLVRAAFSPGRGLLLVARPSPLGVPGSGRAGRVFSRRAVSAPVGVARRSRLGDEPDQPR